MTTSQKIFELIVFLLMLIIFLSICDALAMHTRKPIVTVEEEEINLLVTGNTNSQLQTTLCLTATMCKTATVDTGAASTVVPQDFFVEYTRKTPQSAHIPHDPIRIRTANGSTHSFGHVTMPEVIVAGCHLKDVRMFIGPEGSSFLIGVSTLKKLGLLEFNFEKLAMTASRCPQS